jgi:hypothetical protein
MFADFLKLFEVVDMDLISGMLSTTTYAANFAQIRQTLPKDN